MSTERVKRNRESASFQEASPTNCLAVLLVLALVSSNSNAHANSDVQVIGEMRRMFQAHDIGPNVDLAKVNLKPDLYALGPLTGLQGEITVLDGKVFVSTAEREKPLVRLVPDARAVFLVHASVAAWQSRSLPANVVTELDLATFLETEPPGNTRSVFLVRGTATQARYHIQHYTGSAESLTHEAHDKAKVFFDLSNAPVELVGFFSNREGDGGSFVHMGQTTHVHVITKDRTQMGHLESIRLVPGAELLLPRGPNW